MKRIELEIVADNSQYIKSTQEVTQATTTMQKTIQKGEVRTKGLIEDTIDALKDYEEKRKKAFTIEGVEKYNRKIAEARKTLQEYNKAGLETEKIQTRQEKNNNTMISGLKKLAASYLTVHAALKVFNAVMNSTQQTGDLLRRELSGIKFAIDELSRSVASGNWSDLGKRLTEARRAGIEYADALDAIGDRERQLRLEEVDRELRMSELAKIYRNTGLVGVEGYKQRQAAAEEYIQLAEEGERKSLELLQLRVDAELDAARQALGFSADISAAEKERVNQQIINNLRSADAFDENKTQIEEYLKLQKELAEAQKGTTTTEFFGEVAGAVTSVVQDTEKIEALKEQIAAIPPEIQKMAVEYNQWGQIVDIPRERITSALEAVKRKQIEVNNSTIRANIMAELAGVRIAEAEEKSLTEREKNLENFIEASLKLRDDYEKAVIDQLTGVEKIEAERDYQLRQYDMLQAHLESLGTLTEDHYKWIEGLRAKAIRDAEIATRQEQQATTDFWTETYDKAIEQRMKFLDFREELDLKTAELAGELTGEKELEIQKKWIQARIDLLKSSQDPILQQQAELLELQLGLIDKELAGKQAEKTIWDYIGLGDSPEAQEAIQNSVETMKGVLDDIFAARLEDAQRTRELYDTQIAETQRALDTETRLMEEGFANNVDAKRKELEQLKVARATALKEEEKALKAQRALDTAMQISSLVTATADIIKAYAKIPIIGQILSIAAIAAMWGTFVAAKTKAAQVTKLAEGGVGTDTGMITGKRHSEGGERLLDHVEVERGEMFGVLNRRASAKYGKAFTEIVNNFNRDNLVVDRSDAVNNINIDVNGLSERLDKVEYQLIRQNEFIMSRPNVQDYPNMRIEKRGNKTRIIRK